MSDPFEHIDFPPFRITDQIYKTLRQLILSGPLKPGDKLPTEDSLCQRFSVSKTAVRESLGQLVAEGLIHKRRGANGGSFVSKGDSTRILEVVDDCYRLGGLSVEEVIQFRRVMEPVVLELACEFRTEEDLEAMRQNLEETGKALAKGQADRDKQAKFHCLIAASCQNRLISATMSAAIKISREFTSRLPFFPEDVRLDYDYNRQFFECLAKRRNDEARELMMGHFELSRKLIERYRRQKKSNGARSQPGEA